MDQYAAEWQTWHDARLADLATPFGWLSVTGLTWLDDGETTTWEGGPGTFERTGDEVRFTVAPGVSAGPAKEALELMGRDDDGVSVRIDSTTVMTARAAPGRSLRWILVDGVMFELINREGHVGLRRHDAKAPLLARFVDVPTFPLDKRWIVAAEYTPFPEPMVRETATAMPGIDEITEISGELRFVLDGHEHRLKTGGCPQSGLSITFHDYTNGDTTASWRRLNIGLPDAGNHIILDFNRALNEPFSFTPYSTCAAPVPENILPLEVTAGERRPTQTLGESGVNTPILLIETSGGLRTPHVLEWLDENGVEVTLSRMADGDELPPAIGYSAIVLFGLDSGAQMTREAEAEVRELITDALATRTPVVGIGSAARLLAEAAGHDSLTSGDDWAAGDDRVAGEGGSAGAESAGRVLDGAEPGGAEAGSVEAGGAGSVPVDLGTGGGFGRMPLAVSPEISEDTLFRRSVTRFGPDGIGYIMLDQLTAAMDAGDRTEAVTMTWRDLIDRFSRMVHARG